MNTIIKPLISIYSVNSTLFINSFKNVKESDANKRINHSTNSMIFLALHTLDARYYLLKSLGVKIKNPFAKWIDWANNIEDIKKYPKLKAVLNDWEKLDKKFIKKLSSVTAKELNKKFDVDFPGNGKPVINMISFLAEHEAYHVGQLAFLRKYLGYPAVLY